MHVLKYILDNLSCSKSTHVKNPPALVFKNRINLLVLTILPVTAMCQLQQEDSLRSISFNNCKDVYYNAIGSELALSNGTLYHEFTPSDTDQGIPYFGTDEFTEGTIYYDGIYFENVPLLYDIVHDKVITSLSTSINKLELISGKIKFFEINGHRFLSLIIQENTSKTQVGFVELLHDGKLKLYVKWQKERKKITESGEMQIQYEDQNRIYVNKGNKFFDVKTKSSLLQLMEDKRKEVLKFIRENHLDFKGHQIESSLKVISFYESMME
jgi:hypothetical protein